MNILIALDNKEAQRIIAFQLESRLDASVKESQGTVDALKTLEKGEGVDVVLLEGTDQAGSLLSHVQQRRIKTPVLVCILNEQKKSGTFGLKNVVATVSGKDLIEEAIKALDKWNHGLGGKPLLKSSAGAGKDKTAEGELGRGEGEFTRINTNLLLRVSPLKAPIYIRLSKSKFVKLFQEGDVFDKADLEKYLGTKKIDYFYLLTTECGEFVMRLRDDLLAILASAKGQKDIAKISGEVSESVHETVRDLVNTMGVTPEVQQVVKASMDMAIKAMGKSPRLGSIIDRLKKDRTKYISSHSMMLGEIACSIAAAAGWHSEQTFYKLNLAAFLHDIPLKNQELATLQSLKELDERRHEFTEKEVIEFRDHPQAAAEIAKQFTEVPPDVDVIVGQHHERPDGTGFPRGLTQMNISPLGACFIVAHDLLTYIMANDKAWSMGKFVEGVEGKYSGGNFKKIMKVLGDAVL